MAVAGTHFTITPRDVVRKCRQVVHIEPYVEDVAVFHDVVPQDTQLVFLPFQETTNELIQLEINCSVQRNALWVGKNI
jgi:hypothetical protein